MKTSKAKESAELHANREGCPVAVFVRTMVEHLRVDESGLSIGQQIDNYLAEHHTGCLQSISIAFPVED